MPSDFNIRIVILLFLLSIAAIVVHRLGGLKIELPLISQDGNFELGQLSSDQVSNNFEQINGIPKAVCHLTDTSNYNFCGITIVLGEEPQQGKNLSIYNSVQLDIELTAPVDNPRVRFSMRNFDPSYSNSNDYVSLKFNSIKYAPNINVGSIDVPFNAFQVESWWVEQYEIGFDNAHLDYSNITYVEIVTDDMSLPGTYSLMVQKATLSGELITEQELLKIILVCWLIAIIFLVTLQRNKLKTVSTTDSLTGLLNRRGLNAWVSHNLPSFSIGAPLTMFYLDIDDFKRVNDSYGHLIGDELLCQFCRQITLALNKYEMGSAKYVFSRLSGDEFSIVFRHLEDSQISVIAKYMISCVNHGLVLSSANIKVNMSIGVAISDSDTKNFEALMSKADSAMYHAKKKGKNQFKIFDESVSQEILFRKQVAEKLRSALKEDLFSLRFMPIYHAKDLALYGSEVLLRSEAKSLANIGPDIFIPIAEEYGIIKEIDMWVIESTFKNIVANLDFLSQHSLIFAINISSVELHNSHFPKDLKKLIRKYEINPNCIEIEITETCLVEADELSISVLQDIRKLGIKLALDDFGTGYTAFSQLMRYPVDYLKIDKSFIDDLTSNTESRKTMLKAILSIAKAYHLQTIAEGIESISQYRYLTDRGCDMVQGYLFSKPLEWENLKSLAIEPKEVRLKQHL